MSRISQWRLSEAGIAMYNDFLRVLQEAKLQMDESIEAFIQSEIIFSADGRERIMNSPRLAHSIVHDLPSHQGVFRKIINMLLPN